ncbi:hypothetical protein ACFPRL_20435 [Pseudoclavibacter helvolus]
MASATLVSGACEAAQIRQNVINSVEKPQVSQLVTGPVWCPSRGRG